MKRRHLEEIKANAQPEVKAALKRWFSLPEDERSNEVLLYWLLGAGTPAYKMSKKESKYTDKAKGDHNCGNCEFTYHKLSGDRYICSQISGDIKLPGWCKLHKLGKQ